MYSYSTYQKIYLDGRPHGVMANVLDCGFEVSVFELQSRYYFWTNTFKKGRNPLIPLAMSYIVPLLSSFKDVSLVLNNPRRLICH